MTREQALKIIDSSDIIYADYDELEAFSMAIAALRQPEEKKGKWRKNDNGTYSCSFCQTWIPNEQHYYANYCLYCGAEMEE